MRALPGMVVINPCDYNQTKAATLAVAEYYGPVYLRFGRPAVPNFTPEDQVFEIGKAVCLNEGTDVTIFATGHMVWEAVQAGELLEAEGISAEIIDIATRGAQHVWWSGRTHSRNSRSSSSDSYGVHKRCRQIRPERNAWWSVEGLWTRCRAYC